MNITIVIHFFFVNLIWNIFTLQRFNIPMLRTKFLFLNLLSIYMRLTSCPSYDYFSLVSFLDASPSLETWLLDVRRCSFHPAKYLVTAGSIFTLFYLWCLFHPTQLAEEIMQHESIFGGGSSQLRQMPEQHHGRLKTVRFKAFNSAKSLV